MRRPTIRLAGRLLVAGVLGLALLVPATALAADPSTDPGTSTPASAQPSDFASEQPTESPTDGTVEVDPTFIASAPPTATPVGAVLSETGRPDRTPPPTDTTASQRPTTSSPQGLLVLLSVLATICLACARMPDVRRR